MYNPSGALPEDIQINLLGPDGDKVVTSLNSKKFKVSKEGVIALAIDPAYIPSANNPIDFAVEITATGFTEIIKRAVFKNTSNKSWTLPLFSLTTPPSGVSTKVIEAVTVANSYEMTILNAANNRNTKIVIPTGTTFSDDAGGSISGPLTILGNSFDTDAKSYLPSGGVATNPLDSNGKPLTDPFDFLQVVNFLALDIVSTNYRFVKTFSQPVKITFDINPALINPLTNQTIKEGDIIPVTSYDIDTDIWKEEGNTTVVKEAGKLTCTAAVTHLSYTVVGWKRIICRKGPTFSFKSALKDVDLVYYAQLVNIVDNKSVRDYFFSPNNGSSLTVTYLPKTVDKVKLLVYNYNNIDGGNNTKVVAESATAGLCEDKTLVVDVATLTVPTPVSVQYRVICPKGQVLDEASLPLEAKVQFSEAGKNNWRDLVTFSRTARTFKTYKLHIGKRYDFKMSTDGGVNWPYKQNDYPIEVASWIIEVDATGYCK